MGDRLHWKHGGQKQIGRVGLPTRPFLVGLAALWMLVVSAGAALAFGEQLFMRGHCIADVNRMSHEIQSAHNPSQSQDVT